MVGTPGSLSTILHSVPESTQGARALHRISTSSSVDGVVHPNVASRATEGGGGLGGGAMGGGSIGGGSIGGGGIGTTDPYYSHQNHAAVSTNGAGGTGRLPPVTLPPHGAFASRSQPSALSPVAMSAAHSHTSAYQFGQHNTSPVQPPYQQQQQQHDYQQHDYQPQQHGYQQQQPQHQQSQRPQQPQHQQHQQHPQHQDYQHQDYQHSRQPPDSATPNSPHDFPTSPLAQNHRASIQTAGGAPTSPVEAAPTSTVASNKPADQSRGHLNNTSLYQCAHCQRRYSRPEHLARHIQTHTLGKRFLCSVCNKAFARADLLKRHAANHENDNDPKKRRRTTSAQAAARVSQACRACASARVKCEEVKPCTRCRSRNINCELAAAEPGPSAAMHLVQMSNSAPLAYTTPQPRQLDHPAQASDTSPGASSYHDSPHTFTHSTAHELDQSPPPSHMPMDKHDQSQVAASAMAIDNANMELLAQTGQTYDMTAPHMDPTSFAQFLHGIMYTPLYDQSTIHAEGMAVLDPCSNQNVELNDIDFNMLDHWNLADPLAPSPPEEVVMTEGGVVEQPSEEPVDLPRLRRTLVNVWAASPWRWLPSQQDSAYEEQKNFSVPSGDVTSTQFQRSKQTLDRVIDQKLDPSLRDRVLAIVLSTCKTPAMVTQIASSFPSTDVMDTMVHIFLASHLCSVSSWIHFPLFNLSKQWPDWIAVAAAAGGVLTPVPTLRKFGLALQESVRLTIQGRFEEKNTSIQNMGLLQTLILGQDIGLWSGNRRKMEIAECHLVIPITMMRYRGKFQRACYPVIEVLPSDEGDVLEKKWHTWSERESWKRLVFHCFLREAQTSMTTLTNPAMSYSELSLPLPESRELWTARTAQEWKTRYLELSAGQSKRPPSIGDVFRDVKVLVPNQSRLDIQYTISICLHGFWHLVLEYHNLHSIMRSRPMNSAINSGLSDMVLNNRRTELLNALQSFHHIITGLQEPLLAQECLLLHILFMNLHVSLDDLQLFSGKEGEEQARRTYPILQRWSTTADARKSIWRAGQALAQAKLFPSRHVKEFNAVAVHHAALAIWTYAIITKANKRRPPQAQQQQQQQPPMMMMQQPPIVPPPQYSYDDDHTRHADDDSLAAVPMIHLDKDHNEAVERFISVGTGRPVISTAGGEDAVVAPLDDPKACMEVAQNVLLSNFGSNGAMLPQIVENLCKLIARLGDAADAIEHADTQA